MTALKKVESLRTFVDLDFSYIGPVPSNHCLGALCTIPSMLSPFKNLAHLRYLSLSDSWKERLNNLFYLSLSDSLKASLNHLICHLPKLQILKLQHLRNLYGLPKT